MVPRAGEELYDTWKDPFEFANLAGEETYRGVLERLRAECEHWITATGDVPPEKRMENIVDIYTHETIRTLGGQPGLRNKQDKSKE